MSRINFACFCKRRVSMSVLGACFDPRRPVKWQILQQVLFLSRETNFCFLWNALGRYPWWNHEFNENPRTDQTSVWFLEVSGRLSSTRTDENVHKIRHVTHEGRRPTINGVLMNLRENIRSTRPHNWRIFTSSQGVNWHRRILSNQNNCVAPIRQWHDREFNPAI